VSRTIARGQVEYPSRLDELRSPPPSLHVRGAWPQPPGVAVVGTRRPGRDAERFARALGAAIVRAGLTLWSGGALGVDAAAHEGALEAGGATILVAGGPLDQPYPACHRGLYDRVEASGGALVSLLADGQRPRRWSFLQRNGVLAALTLCTVVVECPLKSGARSTAAAARHLGRPVWIAAQPPWEPELALAVREEVRLGASVLFCVDDLLASLGVSKLGSPASSGRAKSGREGAGRRPKGREGSGRRPKGREGAGSGGRSPGGGRGQRGPVGLPPEAELVWGALAQVGGATHVDAVCAQTGLGAAQVQYGLTLLVLGGWVDEGLAGQFSLRKAPGRGV
jgi:DNA processing protein